MGPMTQNEEREQKMQVFTALLITICYETYFTTLFGYFTVEPHHSTSAI